jgi:FemAB-related protein (PEP-CTERM system-associated)
MSISPKTRKKQILADPPGEFSRLHPGADEQRIAALGELWQKTRVLRNQRNELSTLSRATSRQIGDAKRAGESANDLMAGMQKLTKQLKSIDTQLAATDREILAFFDFAEENSEAENKPAVAAEKRDHRAGTDEAPEVHISLLNDEEDDWNTYVSNNPSASVYHRVEWRNLIHETFGHRGFYFLARDDNSRIRGVLPLIRLKSRLFGNFMVSMPYFNYGGAVADHPLIEDKLMQAANEYARHTGVSHIEYRDGIPRNDLPARTEKVNMVLSLPRDPDSLWNGFSSKLRAQIRRPQRERPSVLFGGMEYLEDFYSVFSRNMRDLGTPVYSKKFFGNILHAFPGESQIIIIRLNARPVAAGFLISHGNRLEIPWASTIRDINHISINMLLYWETLKWAILAGYSHFDFGRSSRDSGTFRFKQQWGARPEQLYWHYWLGDHFEMPSLNPSNPKFALMIRIWKQLPVTVTQWLGPMIVKNLP